MNDGEWEAVTILRVMIVEDDRLARRGIVSLMPWEKYGMTVVAEAANGAAALEILEKTGVDFLITDIEMPVMSGIELIRAVKKLYPAMHVAVLTLHQDFAYVREALRIGAVDYIAKTELEQESFDKVLSRISERIAKAAGAAGQSRDDDFAVVLFCRRMGDFPNTKSIGIGARCEEISRLIRMWPQNTYDGAEKAAKAVLAAQNGKSGYCVLKVSGIGGLPPGSFADLLQAYQERALFYECTQDVFSISKTADELKAASENPQTDLTEAVRIRWLFPNWIFMDDALAKLLADTRKAEIPPARLLVSVSQAIRDLCRVFPDAGGNAAATIQELYCFEQFEVFLRGLSQGLRPGRREAPQKEIVDSVCYALEIIGGQYAKPLHAEEISHMVHMSRSYFFQQFKAMLGVTFNDYVRLIRISHAKEYLEDSLRSVAWVTRAVGYTDEKYFSQVFKSATGFLPREYQKLKAQGLYEVTL